MAMDIPDLFGLFDIEGGFNLQSECDAFLQTPETTISPVDHVTPALDSSAHTPDQEEIPQQRQRRYAPRSRQGCLTCRARRKRCDAHHPDCRNCTRLNAECRWPDKLQISGPSSGAKDVRNRDVATTTRSNLELLGSQTNYTSVNFVADAYPTVFATAHKSIPRSLATETMPGRQSSPTPASLERHLLSYYKHTFIPQVTVVQSSNYFTSLYIPMGFHCTGVMDAIIACAAAHLAKSVRGPEKTRELNSVAIQRQQRAREFITEHTERPGHSASGEYKLEVVVTLLLLIGLETQTGGRSLRWMQRVNCVRQLLQTYSAAMEKRWSLWEMDCVHRHFLYHDVMALIMEDVLDPDTRANLSNRSGPFRDCHATLPASRTQDMLNQAMITTPVSPSEFLQSESISPGVDCILGLSRDLFGIIITQLRDLPSPDSQDMDAPELLKLETDLSNWQYDKEMASTLDLNTRLDLIALAECHRLAALILLYRRYPSRSYCLPHIASQIICTVSRITPTSAVISVLTPVLFLAGAELNSEADMALCAAKLKSIREASKMMNIVSVEEVLGAVWKERLQNRIQTDWLEILRARRWTFSLG